ncbi:jg4833 [Pararge aegeria aegeria]|uniref:Jg4833 protein n=1 Tax=Pararge aegeria aegeria TaxID=348720 RepID=A0A8S4QL31_9NEOP|nr:jg4833 [Pararge aegeria aegeria]
MMMINEFCEEYPHNLIPTPGYWIECSRQKIATDTIWDESESEHDSGPDRDDGVKENIVPPSYLRVLHNVFNGVWSPPIRTWPAWWTTALTPSHCGRRPLTCSGPAMGGYDDDDDDSYSSPTEASYFQLYDL